MTERLKHFLQRYLTILIGVAGLGFLGFVLASRDSNTVDNQATPVETAQVTQQDIPNQFQAVGSLKALNAVDLTFSVDGNIKKLFFKDGQFVAQGMPIAELNDDEDKADLSSSEASLKLSETTLERYKQAMKGGGISQEQLDQLQSDLAAKIADVKSKQAAVSAKIITAPFDGELSDFKVTEGQYTSHGSLIVSLVDKSKLKVEYTVPQALLSEIHEGQSVFITIDAIPGKRFPGSVSFIAPQVDEATRSVSIQATIPNAHGDLSPGAFVRVTHIIEENTDALMIPEEAILASLDGSHVYKIVNGKAVETRVKEGMHHEGMVQIVEGLNAGDMVVTAGQQKLQDGSAVSILTPAEKT